MAESRLIAILRLIILLWLFNIIGTDKSLLQFSNFPCKREEFPCLNGKCVPGAWYCDKENDCGDLSDERFCNIADGYCPTDISLYKCSDAPRCIPSAWICDGEKQCSNGDDELGCVNSLNTTIMTNAKTEAIKWIKSQAKKDTTTATWGPQAPRIAVALFLANPGVFSKRNETGISLAIDLRIQFLWKLASKTLKGMTDAELALYINAFTVSCLNPRKFYGFNLVEELKSRVDSKNHTNPFVMLALCNAGEKLTDKHVKHLIKKFHSPNKEFWTDTQAYIIMTLSCASHQTGAAIDAKKIKDLTYEIKRLQSRNGTVQNLKTTALAVQALLSAEEEGDDENFDVKKAIEVILLHQLPDGSFGNIVNTYYVLPILRLGSLTDVNAKHCFSTTSNEEDGINTLLNEVGDKWRIQYSLWIGDNREVERTLVLRVLTDTSFYEVMEKAAAVDNRYRFKYSMKNGKPYIYSISGIQNDPETEKFWNSFKMTEESIQRIEGSPADLIPKNNTHFIMWYQSG